MALTYFLKNGKYYKTTSSGTTSLVTGSNDLARAKAYVSGGGTTTTTTPTKTSTSSGSSSPTSTSNLTPQQQLEAIKQQALQIQTELYQGVQDGTIKSSSPLTAQQQLNEAVATQIRQGSLPTTYTAPTLKPATAPSSTDQLNTPFAEYTAPTTQPSLGDITLPSAGMQGYQSFIDSQKQMYQQLMDEQKRINEEASTGLKSLIDSFKPRSEMRSELYDEIGMDPAKQFAQQEAGIKEIEALTNDYNRVVQAMETQIAQTNDKMASMNFINNQTAQIKRNAAPQLQYLSAQINAKAAALQALQGNFAQAQQYVNQAVEDAVADYKFKVDAYEAVAEQNQTAFDKLSNIYVNAFNSTMAIAMQDYEQRRAEKEQIGNLLLQYPTAGIDIYNDSLEEAYKKAGVSAPIASLSGSGAISSRTSQVLDGFTRIDQLTPTEAQKVRDELYELGFGSSTAPDWFNEEMATSILGQPITQELLEAQYRVNFDPAHIQTNMEKFTKRLLNDLWTEYKANILGGGNEVADFYDDI